MSTTTENGWTKSLPDNDGVYWYRFDAKSQPDVVEVRNGDIYYIADGVGLSVANHEGGEFLGPFTASDFEQPAALRKAAGDALEWIEASLDYDDLAMDGSRVMAALREALKGESK